MDEKLKYESLALLFVITSSCMSDNYQTMYYYRRVSMIKVWSYKLLMMVFIYNYVYVYVYLSDLKKMATVCSLPSQLLYAEIIGMLMMWEYQNQ